MGDFRRKTSFKPRGRESRDSSGRNREQKDFSRSDRRDSGRSSQNNFNRSERSPRKPSRFGGRNADMTTVICDSCKKSCEVPFKPSSNKPIYCRDCFRKDSGSGSRETRSRDNRSGSNSSSGNVLGEINYKLDKIMRALKIE
jgi:CxxC-x17-CxxC domain-containing protein